MRMKRMMTTTMGHLALVCDSKDDVRVLGNPVVVHRCHPGADLRHRHRYGGVLDLYRPASVVRDHRARGSCGSYHGLGSRSVVLLALRSLDVVKRDDVGNNSRCLARVVLLGGHSNGHGDRWCRGVEEWPAEVRPAALVVHHLHRQLAVVLGVPRQRPPRTRC
ncbi:hypothetical protein [Oryza sativa Japonica Group]|uniref:Uncharacterized protein n=1 Tax=Oryza sativa subsp. japonica TaxID=39947 RepID=Q5QN86_ORYSJ|nr:hypothetical protein [Oryza sativa Japonica Group]BAD73278.1 hypothetical protein [Oryza sativa Japonica Group]